VPKLRLSKLFAATDKLPVFKMKLLVPVYIAIAVLFAVLISRGDMQLLAPAGTVAVFQSKILWAALAFVLIVGSTIVGLFFFVIFHYQEGKGKRYEPTWATSKVVQLLAWFIPSVAIAAISFAVWNTTHMIDPYKPLAGNKPPVTIQVVALRWKWLFLYPTDRLATVNYVEIPINTPVNFELTADAPMSSFWAPSLSGQMYAMPGMVTQLHIQADKVGTFPGSAAEINGDGYSGMDFTVKAVPATDYASWKDDVRGSANTLDYTSYTQLAQPTSYNSVAYYSMSDQNLFNEIVMQFMAPGANQSTLQVRGAQL